MSHLTPRLAAALLLLLGAPYGCRSTAAPEAAPEAAEPLALAVRTREPAPGERLPAVRASGVPAGLTVGVARGVFCAVLVEAAVRRAPGDVAVVARVSGDPLTNCAPRTAVAEYGGTVAGLAAGRYRVRVYEAAGDGPAQLLGIAHATVPPPAP